MNHRKPPERAASPGLAAADRMVISDVDNTLIGDEDGLRELLRRLSESDGTIFGVATGRSLPSLLKAFEEWRIPTPDIIISSVGSEIHYGPGLTVDEGWIRGLERGWERELIRDAVEDLDGLSLQPPIAQRPHKLSYRVDRATWMGDGDFRLMLRQRGLACNAVFSHGIYLDLVPAGVSKGSALGHVARTWGVPLERVVAAGDSGNDEDMLTGPARGVVVGNHQAEIAELRGDPGVFFAAGNNAWGVIEGLEHWGFLGTSPGTPGATLPVDRKPRMSP